MPIKISKLQMAEIYQKWSAWLDWIAWIDWYEEEQKSVQRKYFFWKQNKFSFNIFSKITFPVHAWIGCIAKSMQNLNLKTLRQSILLKRCKHVKPWMKLEAH